MQPHALADYLARLIEHDLKISAMIWGPSKVCGRIKRRAEYAFDQLNPLTVL